MKIIIQNVALDDEAQLVVERGNQKGIVDVQVGFEDGSGSWVSVRLKDIQDALKAFGGDT